MEVGREVKSELSKLEFRASEMDISYRLSS